MMNDLARALRTLRRDGLDAMMTKGSRRLAERFGGNIAPLYLLSDDVVDSAELPPVPPRALKENGSPLAVGWIITAPGPGSGGHTTIFRFVEALESAGHRCVLFIYDGQGGAAERYEELIRTWWPQVRAEVRALHDGLAGMDAYIATAWVTAHALAKRSNVPGRRFYLVQDFEPWFYAEGSAQTLAEDTYRFGFSPITVGRMLADELASRYGYSSTVAPFGCDTTVYKVDNLGERNGVVFYSKPGVDRRGYELGVMALERLHAARPDIEIHTFGMKAQNLPFPATTHGRMSPADLNKLYNRCGAGLALSFTNVSLIPYELLASGVTPVINDLPGHRSNIDFPEIEWARATPRALATALVDAIERTKTVGPETLRARVEHLSWKPAQQAVVGALEEACWL